MKKRILFIILIISFIPLLYYYPLLPNIFRDTGYLFLTKVLPYLFVMMVMSEIFIKLHLERDNELYITKIISKLFNTSKVGSLVYLFSLVSGIPSNVYFMNNLYENGLISKKEIKHILSFTCYFNPLFLYSVLYNIFNNYLAYILFFMPYIYGVFLGIIKRPKEKFKDLDGYLIDNGSFSQMMQRIMNTLLYVFGVILLFRVLFIYLPNISFIQGLLEVTQGLIMVSSYKSINIQYLISSLYISFLGISIHMQIKGIININNDTYKKFILSRVNLFIIYVIIYLFLFK